MQKILIILFLLLIPSNVISDEINYFVSLKYNKVHVRIGPSLNSPIKYIYKKKYLPVKVIDKKEHFRRIIDHKKNSGWIHKTQLIVMEDKIVFSKNTKFSKPLFKLEKGKLVILKKCISNWCKIKTNNYTGWMQTNNSWGEIK